MGSCSFGSSNLKILSSNFGREKDCVLRPSVLGTRTGWRSLQNTRLGIPQWPLKALTLRHAASLQTKPAAARSEGSPEETKYSGSTSDFIPNFDEVEILLTNICDTTSIAEFDLKLGGFELHVMRDLTQNYQPTPPIPPPVIGNTITEPLDSNGSVSSTSLAISRSLPSSTESVPTFLDKAADEGLVILQSPRVGFLRRSRTIKGKRAPPSCKEKQIVKEGQVLCYIEQLGGELPIESDVAGEVIKILREDGDPVGYGDALIAILPSFPGIKKLQS